MRKYLVAGLVALASAGAAQAAPTPSIFFTPGNTDMPGFTSATIFESFAGGGGGGAAYTPAQQDARVGQRGFSETVSGSNVETFTGFVPGEASGTGVGAADNYLAVGPGGTFGVNFGTATSGVNFFSFILGSLDSYNSLRLFFTDGTNQLFTGQQIVGVPVAFNQNGNSAVSGRVSYNLGTGSQITRAEFTSTQQAFEIDDLAAAVPEPATWALMLMGFGAVGYSMRRRSKVRFAYAV